MSVLRDLRDGRNNYDFRRGFRVGAVLSGTLLVLSIGSFVVRGLNLGIDFEGGTAWEYETTESVEDVRSTLAGFGLGDARVQELADDSVRVRSDVDDPAEVSAVSAALADGAGIESADINVAVVGPTWGDEITAAAREALVVFLVVIGLYITVRLEWRMAVGALVATFHDIVITVGVYSLAQFEVTPATVIAFLTILGYSLYDTIVVYDRARENAARFGASGKAGYGSIMNLSLNQVLVRSLNTTITSILPVLAMLLIGSLALGARTLQEFSVALLVGLLVGGYSSIFVAAPVVVALKRREARWRQIDDRLVARGQIDGGDDRVQDRSAPDPVTRGVGATSGGPYGHPPRPRTGRGRGRR